MAMAKYTGFWASRSSHGWCMGFWIHVHFKYLDARVTTDVDACGSSTCRAQSLRVDDIGVVTARFGCKF